VGKLSRLVLMERNLRTFWPGSEMIDRYATSLTYIALVLPFAQGRIGYSCSIYRHRYCALFSHSPLSIPKAPGLQSCSNSSIYSWHPHHEFCLICFSSCCSFSTIFPLMKSVNPNLSNCQRHSPNPHFSVVYSHPLPSNNPIRPAVLPPPISSTDPAIAINLHTPKDILRPGNSSIIRRIPQITDMYPSSMSCASRSSLVVCAARAIIWL
jgi:hypothetical protein